MISQSMIQKIRDWFIDFSQLRDFTCLKLRRLLLNEQGRKNMMLSKTAGHCSDGGFYFLK